MFIFYYIVLHATLHYIIRYFHFLPHSRSLNFCIIQTTSQLILSNNLEGNRGREGLLCAMRFVYSVISLFLDGHWIRLPTHLVCMDDQWEPMHIMWLIPVSDQIASLHVHYYSPMKLRRKKLTVPTQRLVVTARFCAYDACWSVWLFESPCGRCEAIRCVIRGAHGSSQKVFRKILAGVRSNRDGRVMTPGDLSAPPTLQTDGWLRRYFRSAIVQRIT